MSKTLESENKPISDVFLGSIESRIKKLSAHINNHTKSEKTQLKTNIAAAKQKFRDTADGYLKFVDLLLSEQQEILLPPPAVTPKKMLLGEKVIEVAGEKVAIPCCTKFSGGDVIVTYSVDTEKPTAHANKKLEIAQSFLIDCALSVMASLPANLIRVSGIAYKDFGDSLAVLSNFPDNIISQTVTNDQKMEGLLEDIEKRLNDVRARFLSEHSDLISYNEDNPKAPEDFLFVLIDLDNEVSEESKKKLKKFVNSDACTRSGIFFFVCGNDAVDIFEINDSMIITVNNINDDGSASLRVPDNCDFGYKKSKDTEIIYRPLNKKTKAALIKQIASRASEVLQPSFIEPSSSWHTQNSSDGLVVPVGYAGSSTFEFKIHQGTTNYNVLIGGGVGSGKSVLLHNIILGLATRYSPAECQFLLLDYKEGTEFKPYESLPHARILATASETEFGIKTLEFVEKEIKDRGVKFKSSSVSNIADYRKKTGDVMPRWVIIIDEFQKILSDRRTHQRAVDLFNSLVRTGRSFGIHFILATQSLFDVDLPIATQSNLSVRICLKISEIDAGKILHMDNLAPAQFQRPGQAIFNDNNGQLNNNTEIQVPWISNEEHSETLDNLSKLQPKVDGAIVYEGNSFAKFIPSKISQLGTNDNVVPISFGAQLDVEQSPNICNVARTQADPVLILGRDSKKQQLVLETLAQQFKLNEQVASVVVLNFDPTGNQSLSGLEDYFTERVTGLEAIEKFFNDNLKLDESNQSGLRVMIFWGLSKNKELTKKIIIPDPYQETDHPVKQSLLELLHNGPAKGLLSICFIDKMSGYASIFEESIDYTKNVTVEEFTVRVLLDQTSELAMDEIKLSETQCVVQNSDTDTKELATLYKT